MAITISGSGITSANIADGTITTDDILASDVVSLKSGRKNLIINGGFDVWQRGTSFSASGEHGADRWWWSTADTISVNKTTFTEQQNAISIAKSTTTDPCYLAQSVEDVRTAAGKNVTISFYAKADASTTLKVWGYQIFGSGGSSTVLIPVQTDTLTTTWTKYSFTFALPSVEGKTIGTNSNLRMSIQYGADNTWTGTGYLANVQLELGSVATDFEHRSYGEELALCQRYFEIIKPNVLYSPISLGFARTTTNARCDVAYTEKRGSPTISYSNATHFGIYNGANRTVSAVSTGVPNSRVCQFDCTTSSLTAKECLRLMVLNVDASISIDAEL